MRCWYAALMCMSVLPCAACPAVLELEPEEQDELEVDAEAAVPSDAPRGRASASSAGDQGAPPQLVPPVLVDADAGEPEASAGDVRHGAAPGHVLNRAGVLRAVLAAGFSPRCDGDLHHLLQRADGYVVTALGRPEACPASETMLYRLHVSESGEITVLEAACVEAAQWFCDGGGPPLEPERPWAPLA